MRQMQLDLRDTAMCYSPFFPLLGLFSVMTLSHFQPLNMQVSICMDACSGKKKKSLFKSALNLFSAFWGP